MQHVGERLLAGRPQDEPDVRARVGEQPADRVRHGTVVAAAMQLLKQPQRVGDRHQMRGRFARQRQLAAGVATELFGHAERVERAEPMAELEQMLVVDREQRSLERRKHRQLVVGPFDGGERRADRLDFLAAVERLAADQQMRNTARLDRVDVVAREVFHGS